MLHICNTNIQKYKYSKIKIYSNKSIKAVYKGPTPLNQISFGQSNKFRTVEK